MNKFAISMTAALALTSLAFVPAASAGVALSCDTAIERAVCAALETVGNILTVADPIVDFANTEAAWAVGVANGVVVFVGQQVSGACNHLAGACETAGDVIAIA